MMRIFKGILVLAAASALLIQCKKPTDVTPPGPGGGTGGTVVPYYLTSVKYTNNNQDSLVFLRNSSHQVTQINMYNSDNQMYGYAQLSYSSSKLSKMEIFDTTGTSNSYYTYTYGIGQMIMKHYLGGKEDFRWTYTLGPYGKPKQGVFTSMLPGGPGSGEKYVYTYDAKTDNVVKLQHYDSSGVVTGTTQYTYDKKNNGYANLPVYDPRNTELFSKNNITKLDFTNSQGIPSSVSYDYTYGSDNYPTTRHSSINDGTFYYYSK